MCQPALQRFLHLKMLKKCKRDPVLFLQMQPTSVSQSHFFRVLRHGGHCRGVCGLPASPGQNGRQLLRRGMGAPPLIMPYLDICVTGAGVLLQTGCCHCRKQTPFTSFPPGRRHLEVPPSNGYDAKHLLGLVLPGSSSVGKDVPVCLPPPSCAPSLSLHPPLCLPPHLPTAALILLNSGKGICICEYCFSNAYVKFHYSAVGRQWKTPEFFQDNPEPSACCLLSFRVLLMTRNFRHWLWWRNIPTFSPHFSVCQEKLYETDECCQFHGASEPGYGSCLKILSFSFAFSK